jgi:hypothetical protein
MGVGTHLLRVLREPPSPSQRRMMAMVRMMMAEAMVVETEAKVTMEGTMEAMMGVMRKPMIRTSRTWTATHSRHWV